MAVISTYQTEAQKPTSDLNIDDICYVTDTGSSYIVTAPTVWTPLALPSGINNQKTIKTLSDFPTPVNSVITLIDNTTYQISGTVDIGTNRIVCGIKNTFIGNDKNNDILLSTTSGIMITLDSTSTNNVSLTFNTLTLKCANGTLFSVTSSALRNVVIINNVNITAVATIGTFNNCSTLTMRNSAFLSNTAAGVSFTGANGKLQVRDSLFQTTVGTCFALGTATFTSVEISRNVVTMATGETFLSGTTGSANVSIIGTVFNNIFSGAGTFVNTITTSDTLWKFTNNDGTSNSVNIANGAVQLTAANKYPALDGSLITNVVATQGNLTGVVTSVGLATSIANSAITNAMLANGAVANLSGTNTGDNATNSQYSGLVSNATHTGDATGATALTVVKINGILMSGLATGILKNTTSTGEPSIAVAGDFPTLNQNTTGSAATLTTPRTINGVAFDGSANISVPATLTATTVEVDLGSTPISSGSFIITTTGLTNNKPVLISQANSPYTNKGGTLDESEMDGISITGQTTSTTQIQCYWNSKTLVKGNYKFNYITTS